MSLAVLGTMSDAGKSTIAAGICRLLANHGRIVAPFKAQNMSNNATPALLPDKSRREVLYRSFEDAVGNVPNPAWTPGSMGEKEHEQGYGEIGSAQGLQAEACKQVPRVEMNPLLLKSGGRNQITGEFLCSVVVLGKQIACETYGALGRRTTTLKSMIIESHQALQEATNAEVIVIEGAGSCTELNLMERDVVNLPLVREIECPWLLVANIDCGGVFAQIVGTKMCVSERDWSLCCGIVVNKLRGEPKYFHPGPRMIESMVGKPVFVVPHLHNLNLPEEDALGIERRLKSEDDYPHMIPNPEKPVVVVVAYPHTAITDDLCPLETDPRFSVQWRRRKVPKPYPHTSAVVLPGSRLTRSDLKWLHDSGWYNFILEHHARGGAVLGLCGGYQMLGRVVHDPDGVESEKGSSKGLALLPIETTIAPAECKIVKPRKAMMLPTNIEVEGFELHCGRSTVVSEYVSGYERVAPLLVYEDGTKEGLVAGRVYGTYLHGILRSVEARERLLLGEDQQLPRYDPSAVVDPLDRLASHLEECGLDHETLSNMLAHQVDLDAASTSPISLASAPSHSQSSRAASRGTSTRNNSGRSHKSRSSRASSEQSRSSGERKASTRSSPPGEKYPESDFEVESSASGSEVSESIHESDVSVESQSFHSRSIASEDTESVFEKIGDREGSTKASRRHRHTKKTKDHLRRHANDRRGSRRSNRSNGSSKKAEPFTDFSLESEPLYDRSATSPKKSAVEKIYSQEKEDTKVDVELDAFGGTLENRYPLQPETKSEAEESDGTFSDVDDDESSFSDMKDFDLM